MYADRPWTRVRCESGEYYVYQIENAHGHIASITGWGEVGNTCPVTEAHARLFTQAADLAEVVDDLLKWAERTGGWDAPCWARAAALREMLLGSQDDPSDDP